MSNLLALAERCEAATEPDRVLDRDIAIATFAGAPDEHARKVVLSHGAQPWNYEVSAFSGVSLRTPPSFTASLDAALQLVKEGDDWIRQDFRSMTVVRFAADLKMWGTHFDATAATPALAACAAALRARVEASK